MALYRVSGPGGFLGCFGTYVEAHNFAVNHAKGNGGLGRQRYTIQTLPEPPALPKPTPAELNEAAHLAKWNSVWDQVQQWLPRATKLKGSPRKVFLTDKSRSHGWVGEVRVEGLGEFTIFVDWAGEAKIVLPTAQSGAHLSPSKALRIFQILLDPNEE